MCIIKNREMGLAIIDKLRFYALPAPHSAFYAEKALYWGFKGRTAHSRLKQIAVFDTVSVQKVRASEPKSLQSRRSKYRLVKIGQLVVERKEIIKPWLRPGDRFNYIGLEQVESDTGGLIDFKSKVGREIRSPSKKFKENDVLYGRLRCYLNRVYLAEGTVPEGVCSAEFWTLKPDDTKISPVLLRELLASEHVLERVKRKQVGVVFPRLPLDALLKIKVPIPPLDIQRNLERRLRATDLMRRQAVSEAKRHEATRVSLIDEIFELKGGND